MSSIIQPLDELEKFHTTQDPWGYNTNISDRIRRETLLTEINNQFFSNILDIGCGQGFITRSLIGEKITGIDISEEAIKQAKLNNQNNNIEYLQGSIFDLNKLFKSKSFDLIIITGVLYKQYIGDSSTLIYHIIDDLLMDKGKLITVHIDEWKLCSFPYRKVKVLKYPYREYIHNLEIYFK